MGILSVFKKSMHKVFEDRGFSENNDLDDSKTIALGVLLWAVAESDHSFLPEEKEKIMEVLKNQVTMTDQQLDIVLVAIDVANKERIELYSFCQEVSADFVYEEKMEILENLFRVACADNQLAEEEVSMIRKISGLIRIDHKGFIEAKIKIKKEFGMDTVEL